MDFDFSAKPKVTILYDETSKIISAPEIYDLSNIKYKGAGELYFNQMIKHKDKVAQYVADTNEEDTFASLLQRCVRTALHLQTRQLNKDDIICLCTYNQINSCVPFIASIFLGQKVTCLDPSFNVSDAARLIKLVKPKIIFICPDSIDLIEKATIEAGVKAELVVFGKTERHTPFEEFLVKSENEESFKPVQIENQRETGFILFSSGTTGLPKGICLNYLSLTAQSITSIYPSMYTSVTLNYTSMYWISSMLFLFASILSGGARVLCKEIDGVQLWQLINKYNIHAMFFNTVHTAEMLKAGRPKNANTSSLATITIAGTRIHPKQLEAMRKVLPGTTVAQGYGQTEVAGFLTMFNITDESDQKLLSKKIGSCGKPLPGREYKVVNIETEQLCGPNEEGELRIKTKYMMNGYYNTDSSDAFDSEGWLKTGDIVYFDEDFCFFVTGRVKEMLKFREWHVQPAVIEQALLNHPAIKEAIVIGVPHEVDGDHPMALVILNEDCGHYISVEEIIKFVAQRLHDRQKLRGGVKILKEFPRTPTGKIRRRDLRELVLKGLI